MLTITPQAARQIQALLAKQGKPQGMLRLRVAAGGCSGLNMEFELAEAAGPDDKVYEAEGARVVVDPKSEFFLYGSRVDYRSSLMQSGFVVDNPSAKTTCSCGTSFSV